MITLGISGIPDRYHAKDNVDGLSPLFFHDSSIALVVNGEPVFAAEEERFSRLKHTNAFPEHAIAEALLEMKMAPDQIEHFAFFFEEEYADLSFFHDASCIETATVSRFRERLGSSLEKVLGIDVDRNAIVFIDHHVAHATSSYLASPFDTALSIVIDGNGERDSTSVFLATPDKMRRISVTPTEESLGHLYRFATQLIGFRPFDEYKVMGLAPYGDPEVYRQLLGNLCRVSSEGTIETQTSTLPSLIRNNILLGVENLSEKQIFQRKANFAATLQAVLESTIIDLVSFWVMRTGNANVCLSGGVALNCVANSALSRIASIDAVFVHPASHDAGAALGAALAHQFYGTSCERSAAHNEKCKHVFSPYIGSSIQSESISECEKRWAAYVAPSEPQDIPMAVANRLKRGEVIGWADGRAEFGPRALGNRSILADARPHENWSRVNRLVKDRESFRPFAPAVLAGRANEIFDMPSGAINLEHMVFVANVRKEWRTTLQAITHVDGTARVQVVRENTSSGLHEILTSYERLTESPVLLNTSFNNAYEPIVQTASDAFLTFLTTGITCLAFQHSLYEKVATPEEIVYEGKVRLSPGSELSLRVKDGGREIWNARRPPFISVNISEQLARMLRANKWIHSQALLEQSVDSTNSDLALREIVELWKRRIIEVEPDI